MADDHDAVVYSGDWVNGVTEDFDAALQISFFGEEITLTLGTDDDRSICDVLVDNAFWGSLDTYAATPGELAVTIPLARLGLHVVEIRNRPERNKASVPTSSTSFKLEFVQMETAYDVRRIDYDYDDLSRLVQAEYFEISNGIYALSPTRVHEFTYDVAGNRTSDLVTVISEPEPDVTTYTYDAANRISSAGFAYNDAGQMTADGTLSYSWDRAGRLLGAGDSSYAYNGLGQRVQQTVSGVVTDYLLDVQPGLAKVIAATTGANTERFVHERGLLSQQDSAGDWQWMVADGLGSVRGVVDGAGFDPAYSVHYAPYGQSWGEQGTEQTPFGFTGEPTDDNGLVHLRARYYNPALGAFPALDPVEGVLQQAISLNRYAYVAGNVVNRVDPSGMILERVPDGCNLPQVGERCPEDRPSEQRLSDYLVVPPFRDSLMGPLRYESYIAEAKGILYRELYSGGNCGVEILNNVRLLDHGQLAVEILAQAANDFGPWAPPPEYEITYASTLSVRGQVVPIFSIEVYSTTLSLCFEPQDWCKNNYEIYVQQNQIIKFGPGLFLLNPNDSASPLRPNTGDMFSTFIEESGHAWQILQTGGFSESPDNPEALEEKNTGYEFQVKAYVLYLSQNGIELSSQQMGRLCQDITIPGGYGYVDENDTLPNASPPDNWPYRDLWPMEVQPVPC